MKQLFTTALAILTWGAVQAQSVADFENLNLPTNTYWDGSATPSGTQFQSANAIFPNLYDTSFGGFWAQGWAYSSVNDSTTAGYTNLFAASAFTGFGGQGTYALGQDGAKVLLDGPSKSKVVNGFYASNTTYAYLSMRDGDGFAKKFGGPTGNDPDFFLLQITGWFQGQAVADTVDFYLADYRFADNTQDYIVKDWTWVDLTPLGNLDSLTFHLSSSDNSGGWMNTPAFFAMDHFTKSNSGLTVNQVQTPVLHVYPNPASEWVYLNNPGSERAAVQVVALDGRLMESFTVAPRESAELRVINWNKGLYVVRVTTGNQTSIHKIVVQ